MRGRTKYCGLAHHNCNASRHNASRHNASRHILTRVSRLSRSPSRPYRRGDPSITLVHTIMLSRASHRTRQFVSSATLRTLTATLLQLTQHGTGLGSSHFESHVPIYSIKLLHLRTHVLSVSDLSAPHPWITKTQQAFISSTLESTTNSNQFQPIPPNSRKPGFKLQQCTNFCSSDPWRQVSTPKARTANDRHSDPNPFHLA